MATVSFRIEGMTCGGCVRRVKALLQQAGAARIDHIDIGSAQVTLGDGVLPQAMVEVLEQAGYTVKIEDAIPMRD